MIKLSRLLPTVMISTALLLSQGCAGKSNHALVKSDMALLAPIKMVRYETPGIMKASGAETTLLALVTIAAPGGSALLVVGDAVGKSRGSETQGIIPDFGSAVMERFLVNVRQAVPGWPELLVVRDPIKEEMNEPATVIELDVKRLAYGSIDLSRGGIVLERGLDKGVIADGFLSKTVVKMKDPKGEVLWEKSYVYLSKDFGRERTLEELEADNCSLLKEEMMFAAEKTAQDFIDHLNGKNY
ncbi:MAG: hypothetical protein HZB33_16090 [Nitrospirae bacterium]|nr:hypothetical protein [Nitrospirota bacterium]